MSIIEIRNSKLVAPHIYTPEVIPVSSQVKGKYTLSFIYKGDKPEAYPPNIIETLSQVVKENVT